MNSSILNLNGTVKRGDRTFTYKRKQYVKEQGECVVVLDRWDTGEQELVIPQAQWIEMLDTAKAAPKMSAENHNRFPKGRW